MAEWLDELTALEQGIPAAPWHAGRTVGRTLYQGDGPDDLIGIMDSRELAAFVALARNHLPRLLAVARLVQPYMDAVNGYMDALLAYRANPVPDDALWSAWREATDAVEQTESALRAALRDGGGG